MLGVLLLAFAWPDAGSLYIRSLEAETENKRRMAVYLFREDIAQYTTDERGRELNRVTTHYEVQMIGGRLVHRRVGQDGTAVEAPKRRTYPYSRLGALHSLKVKGESVEDGFDCWIVEGRPRLFARAANADEERLKRSVVTVWIDKNTFHRVRMDAVEKRGETVSFRFAPRDEDVWLVTAIIVRIPQGRRFRYIEQIYSDYRRFTSDSTVTVVP